MSRDLECLTHTFHIIMTKDLTIPLYIQLQKLPEREPLLEEDLSPSSEKERERESLLVLFLSCRQVGRLGRW
jgi:hypothetical protein